jgi:hypothetical protein
VQETRRLTAEELYALAEIAPVGTTPWEDKVPSKQSGVYVISTVGEVIHVNLPGEEQPFWLPDQTIVYIGRAKHLSRRLRQFQRHVYGQKSPHRGGQAILLLNCSMTITWAEVSDYAAAEAALIEAFQAHCGKRPFGNRVRAALLRAPSP